VTRRDFLLLGGIVAVVASAQAVIRRWPVPFEFADIRGVPGFRRLTLGPSSVVADPLLVGLDRPSTEALALQDRVRGGICDVVFPPSTERAGRLPMAVFSDYFCPNCPELSRLVQKVAEQKPVAVRWIDMPILGPRSVAAARLSRAAALQGQAVAAHDHLMTHAVPPGPAGAAVLASALSLDAERLARDLEGPEVQAALDKAQAIAAVLGIIGTPATLVGRTLVIGGISQRDLLRLIELESAAATSIC
jgi:predicted DsbA family dithiol-disulfide isomerase